jgi:DNA-binding NarL/FixJ family response regulator
MKRVLVAVPDLFFGVPITNAVRAAGAEPIPVRRPEDAFAALASEAPHPPDAVIVDLAARLDPADVIAAAAAQNIPVFAFGSHLDTAAILAARAAGADKVVANSAMAGALPAWLAYHLAHGPAEG